jgi:hypothetical protein
LQDAAYERLNYLDALVAGAGQQSKAALADTEITRLTTAWRALLAEHEPDSRCRCRQCCTRRRHNHLCSVWPPPTTT